MLSWQVLNLDFCSLSELPVSLGQLTALTTLDVEGNPYLGLGDTFGAGSLVVPPAFSAACRRSSTSTSTHAA